MSVCIRKVLRAAISTEVFLAFLCFQANAEMVLKFHVATGCFSCSPSDLNSSELSPITVKATKIIFLNYTVGNSFIKSNFCAWSLSQATACNDSNAFTFTLPLPEGRSGDAWKSSNKKMIFLYLYRDFSLSPTLLLYFQPPSLTPKRREQVWPSLC
jgi:hypothetical protein